MKALKITLILVAVILLVMSGLSLDNIDSKEVQQTPEKYEINLITHSRTGTDVPGNS